MPILKSICFYIKSYVISFILAAEFLIALAVIDVIDLQRLIGFKNVVFSKI
ncbi:MAG: hypothetical protein IT544_05730 [Rhodobacteraceae bacterium]|nr:hypothetical protein [Paracoccaceae bacterium]